MSRNKATLFTLHSSLFTLVALLLLTACAYQPSSHVIRNLFSDSVYVEVKVDRAEPENAPFVRDEMNRIVYTRFKGRIVPKEQAESKIYISYSGTYFRPLSYQNGYVTRCRAYTRVRFKMETKKGKIVKNIRAIYEADIQDSALTSSALRIDAIKKGLEKAMDEFIAYVSAQSLNETASERKKKREAEKETKKTGKE